MGCVLACLNNILAIGTDGEQALTTAFQKQFRFAIHLRCFRHCLEAEYFKKTYSRYGFVITHQKCHKISLTKVLVVKLALLLQKSCCEAEFDEQLAEDWSSKSTSGDGSFFCVV